MSEAIPISQRRPKTQSRVYNRKIDLLTIKKTTREGRFLTEFRAQLTKQVGGNPNFIQKQWIERAAKLALRIELIDEKTLGLDLHLTHTVLQKYTNLTNCLNQTLALLNIKDSSKFSFSGSKPKLIVDNDPNAPNALDAFLATLDESPT